MDVPANLVGDVAIVLSLLAAGWRLMRHLDGKIERLSDQMDDKIGRLSDQMDDKIERLSGQIDDKIGRLGDQMGEMRERMARMEDYLMAQPPSVQVDAVKSSPLPQVEGDVA